MVLWNLLAATLCFCGHGVASTSENASTKPQQVDISYGEIEPLLKEYGVDLVVWGHEHVYERPWPVYGNVVYNGSRGQPYRSPSAPSSVERGLCGLIYILWCGAIQRLRLNVRFEVHNRTHVYLSSLPVEASVGSITQVSVEKKNAAKPPDYPKVTDKVWIVQENHIPFALSET